jgi:chromate transporter
MTTPESQTSTTPPPEVSLWFITKAWLRLGLTGFGGPQAHVVLLRKLMVDEHQWLSPEEFEHAVATTNLLPGPASTQLAIYCGWRLRRNLGALLAGLCFIVPGLIAIIILSALVLSSSAPNWLLGAAAGASAVVPIIAIRAGVDLMIPSFRRVKGLFGARSRWMLWIIAGFVACLTLGPALVLALLACGIVEALVELWRRRQLPTPMALLLPLLGVSSARWLPVAWTALKVGLLSFGGGFVIIPLMQSDAVHRYHWMTNEQFTTAVALGQLTPGPVVQTVSVVGYAAGGVAAAILAAVVAFAPSFAFIMLGGPSFERLRSSLLAQGFLAGAGPAAIGAILATSILLARSLTHLWEIPLIVVAIIWLLVLRRGTVSMLLLGLVVGGLCVAFGLPH